MAATGIAEGARWGRSRRFRTLAGRRRALSQPSSREVAIEQSGRRRSHHGRGRLGLAVRELLPTV
eukprot:7931200-Alexandrium_andersonii.AAC.1